MSGKNQFPFVFEWFSVNPITLFQPQRANQSAYPLTGGTATGAMASTNTIYSQILDVSKIDNSGLEITWTGTPTGTLSILVSNSGVNFYALTFNPALTQPGGSGGGYAVNLNQLPFKYMLLQYTNGSGTGVLSVYGQNKDLN